MDRVSIFLTFALLVIASGCSILPNSKNATATLTTIAANASATSTEVASGTPAPTDTGATTTPQATTTGTVTPTLVANATPEATRAVSLIYPAPNLLSPGPKDPRRPNEDFVFEWSFADGRATNLRAGECYVVELKFVGRLTKVFRADSWDSCTFPNAFVFGAHAQMTLNRPGFRGPSYSGLVGPEKDDYDAQWRVTIVRKTGNLNATHISFVPLSPPSAWLAFPVQGG